MTLYTIGHSTHPIGEFIQLLLGHGISLVVDIRTIPRSRHNPQFNQESLPGALKESGIEYHHMKALAGLRHTRKQAFNESPNTGWKNASFRGFADYMQTEDFEAGLKELIGLSRKRTIAIMCAEALPWRCHRSLIADALYLREVHVEHILSLNHSQPHRMTPFARAEGQIITYPDSNELQNKLF